MNESVKYWRLDRRTVGTLEAIKRVMDKLTTYSISGSGISAAATLLADSRINLILPIIAAIIGASSQAIREILSFIITASEVKNPIRSIPTEK